MTELKFPNDKIFAQVGDFEGVKIDAIEVVYIERIPNIGREAYDLELTYHVLDERKVIKRIRLLLGENSVGEVTSCGTLPSVNMNLCTDTESWTYVSHVTNTITPDWCGGAQSYQRIRMRFKCIISSAADRYAGYSTITRSNTSVRANITQIGCTQ